MTDYTEQKQRNTNYKRGIAQNRVALHLYTLLGRPDVKVVKYRDWGTLNRTQPGEQLLPHKHPTECGTTNGWRTHHRNGTPPCPSCREAHRLEHRSYNRTRKQKLPAICHNPTCGKPAKIKWCSRQCQLAARRQGT